MGHNRVLEYVNKLKNVSILDKVDLRLSKNKIHNESLCFEERYNAVLENTQLKSKIGLI